MPSPGQAWGTKAFPVDGAQAQPMGDEAFIRRVEAVPVRVMFEAKEVPRRDRPRRQLHADGDARPCGSQEGAGHGHISALVG